MVLIVIFCGSFSWRTASGMVKVLVVPTLGMAVAAAAGVLMGGSLSGLLLEVARGWGPLMSGSAPVWPLRLSPT